MKKFIAGAALVTTILGSGAGALADTNQTTTTTQTGTTVTTGTPVQVDSSTVPQAGATGETTTTTGTSANTPTTSDTATTTTVQTATTTELQLPEVSLTPDKLFYALKLWVENIKVAITRDAAEKAALLEQQAQTRLAEAKAMADAGKNDLAQQAMNEAKAKLEEAQKAIEAAAAANKDISKLTAQIEADQTRFAATLVTMVEQAPEEVKVQLEPVVAELLVQVAATQDAATQDEAAKEEAEKLAEEAKLAEELAKLQPRMVLVLNAMAKASDTSLAEVYEMYKVNPGLGRIAKELGIHMGAVQHAAQIEWKKGDKIEIKFEVPVKAEAQVEAESDEAEAETEEAKIEIKDGKIEIKVERDSDDDDDRDDEDDEDDDKKGGFVPPGLAKKGDFVPPGLAKKIGANGKGKN